MVGRRVLLIIASLVLMGAGALATTFNLSRASASATTPQISVTGNLVAGKYGQAGVPVMLKFTVHNQSSAQYWPFDLSYFVSSNASVVSIVCVATGGAIVGGDLDNNTCSGWALGAHRSDESAILVNANSDPPNLTIKACVGHTPKARTFCNTQVVFLND